MRVRRLATAAFAAVFAVAGVAACSEDEGADNTKTEAKALADQAVAAMKKVQYIKGEAKGKDEEGKDVALSMCADMTGKTFSAKGTMAGHAVEMIEIGDDKYMKGDGKFWASVTGGGEDPEAAATFDKVLGGKYVLTKADPGDEDGVTFFEGGTDGVTKGEVTTFQGKKAVPLVKTKSGDKTTYYVAAKGDPVVLGQLEENKDGSRNEVTYSKSSKCEAQAPAKDQVMTDDDVEAALEAEKAA
ncbi:hypothetical protein [Yinghuangia soli]|uniref:Lipoprotein n=1 Tax=Yinghuangia soli TaxID=2908204 RepID=A0AA41Q1N5_9ACTN|nr:hypothetical protein [Yinghuangia soli]MCF2529878.1 hypothetical protein [Yinghuangia soli]